MSFEGFSEVEIQKINTARTRKLDVKLAKNIPCHAKVKQVVTEKDENQNRTTNRKETSVAVEADSTIKEAPDLINVPLMEPEINPNHEISNQINGFDLQRKLIEEQEKMKNIDKSQLEINANDERSSRILDFDLQRKLMEEQNKMKRNLLQDAISKHAEKTQADAKKLSEIKSSLDQLDSELSNDVSILRKQIETATLHFNNVEKNYSAIERSFLKAKQELYQAHEKKEMLTEHLYTIIAHNEDRKAKRLSELMERVGLTLNENGA